MHRSLNNCPRYPRGRLSVVKHRQCCGKESNCLVETTMKPPLFVSLSTRLWNISLFLPIWKSRKPKAKRKVQDASKIVLHESSRFLKSTFRFHPFGWHYAFLHWSLLVSLFGLTPWKKKAPHLVFYGHRETFFLCLTFSQVMAWLVLPSFVLNVLYVKDRACDRWGMRRWMGSK
jgi:hypothetical protein